MKKKKKQYRDQHLATYRCNKFQVTRKISDSEIKFPIKLYQILRSSLPQKYVKIFEEINSTVVTRSTYFY